MAESQWIFGMRDGWHTIPVKAFVSASAELWSLMLFKFLDGSFQA